MKHDDGRRCVGDGRSRRTRRQAAGSGCVARTFCAIVMAAFAATGMAFAAPAETAAAQDWPMFGGNVESTGANPDPVGITAANVGTLRRRQVALPGTVDASAIYLHGVEIGGARHDAIFVTTSYGKTLALDADSGAILWEFTPSGYARFVGTYRITTSTPAADPDRSAIYATASDGVVRKLAVSDGHVLWQTTITKLPQREKMDSPLKVWGDHVIAVTAGYIGDQPPYQGHVAILDRGSGRLLSVWNTLCSDRAGLLDPATCPASDAAIWGRAGAVVDPASGHIFIATGNAPWNGKTDWGDAVLELDADATRLLGNYTPANTEYLNAHDLDLGSTSPAWLGGGLIAQGGKDGKVRLLDLQAIAGSAPHRGGELQVIGTPGRSDLFTQPAVWRHDGQTWLFLASNRGTAAWQLVGRRLEKRWDNVTAGTSPFVGDGLLFVYDPAGRLKVYDARSGRRIVTLPAGPGHWNSPIVVAGRIILPEGNANDHATHGVLDIWSLPATGS